MDFYVPLSQTDWQYYESTYYWLWVSLSHSTTEVLWTCYETLSDKVQPFEDMKCAIEFLNIYLLDSDFSCG